MNSSIKIIIGLTFKAELLSSNNPVVINERKKLGEILKGVILAEYKYKVTLEALQVVRTLYFRFQKYPFRFDVGYQI